MNARTHIIRWLMIGAGGVLVIWCGAACAGGSSGHRRTPSAIAASPVPSVESDESEATRAAGSRAAQFASGLFQPGDLPTDFVLQQSETKLVPQADVPGLTSDASGVVGTWATADSEFVSQFILVPDDESSLINLLDGFNGDSYRAGLTGGAADAELSEHPAAAGPPSVKVITYSGTVPGGRRVEGEAMAFTHGRAFVVITHGRYQLPGHALDVGSLANGTVARLVASGR